MFGLASRSALGLLIWLGLVPAAPASGIELAQDGWYRWEVAAGRSGQDACCYRFTDGAVKLTGCRLGDGMDEFTPAGECDVTSDSMQVFVRVHGGLVREIRPLSSNCPVKTQSEVHTLEHVSASQSIAWLRKQAQDSPEVADEAIMTLSFHAEAIALPELFDIVEDRSARSQVREQALFWLVQTDSDEAYAYLDKLLN